ncbi:TRAP transporter large permease [Arenicella xantha]|uniref:TRAP transporter large permease protein n=1 Tax=Arenicella xantha TaxID=644221 RepID=A0A395JN70_9GAMM|nr:TRAP transporter large permease [Arenicella xantha]RBP53009.1 tripartite ATP-independent transporter DctM subunit [Arenicella xantha]
MTIAILLLVFIALLLMGVPIAFSIGIATVATMLVSIDALPALTTVAQRMAGGLDSFSLLAIPFFILSGQLMGQGGIARRLIDFARSLVGMLPGGLAFVNVISCTLFGAISGSAVAATSAIGSFMMPVMEKDGYPKEFNAALTAASSTTGLLIPPSNILIVFAVASGGVSISALFVGGYLPGVLVALGLMMVSAVYAKKYNFPRGERVKLATVIKSTTAALPSLFLIVLVIGGILGGIFTATEAGAIAVLYALTLSVFVYREVQVSELYDVLIKSAKTTAIVMLLIATSTAMSWILAYENIPTLAAQALLTLSDNPIIILLIINLILLLVGAFLDMTPAVLIFTPILLPVAVALGMTPLHFGIMMVLNLSIGLCTPPVGSVLFVACAVGKTRVASIVRPLMPMYVAMFGALLAVTYIPGLSEWLPRAFGLID